MGCGASLASKYAESSGAVAHPVHGKPGDLLSASSSSGRPFSGHRSKPSVQPLPVLADNAERLVIRTQMPIRQYRLNPVWASKMDENGSAEIPEGATDRIAWRRAHWALLEKSDGLQLELKSKEATEHNKLFSWSGVPRNHLTVEVLPTISLEGLRVSEHRHSHNRHSKDSEDTGTGDVVTNQSKLTLVEVISIPEEYTEAPEQIAPFIVRWEHANGRKKVCVIGCEDEDDRSKWVAQLKLYSNIEKRYCSAMFWKLRHSVLSELPADWQEGAENLERLSDLESWRRRLFSIEHLHTPKALCMTYVSEKLDTEELVANVLAQVHPDKVEAVASVKRLAKVTVTDKSSQESSKARTRIELYDLAIARTATQETRLPKNLYLFEVRQRDDCTVSADDTYVNGVYAFESPEMRDRWIAALTDASRLLAVTKGLPEPQLVEEAELGKPSASMCIVP